jgi:hypothetical protein
VSASNAQPAGFLLDINSLAIRGLQNSAEPNEPKKSFSINKSSWSRSPGPGELPGSLEAYPHWYRCR